MANYDWKAGTAKGSVWAGAVHQRVDTMPGIGGTEACKQIDENAARGQEAKPPRFVEGGDEVVTNIARDLIVRGWIINALNPKGTVFLLAVVPQFLNLGQPLAPQYLVIALTLGFTDLVVMAGYTALAARLLRTLKSTAHIRALNRVFGTLFVVAGGLLAMFKRSA